MSDLLQKREDRILAPYAIKSRESDGRKFPETFDDGRLAFQRDKDRIIHCKAFRRLDEKTQVFMAGSGDHYRTRLTHTLEVAQISRDIARRLGLNEDLCEAIALAHDLGHPPFGHAGEHALNDAVQEFGLHFEHNEQSRRVVETLEKAYPDFDGLNLTFEVLDGLIKHQSAWDQAGKKFEVSAHLEAQVVNIADEIAYTNHDMDDGLRSGLINLSDLKKFEIWKMGEEDVMGKYGKDLDLDVYISRVISAITSIMIEDLCKQTLKNISENSIESPVDAQQYSGILADFSSKMKL
ncbi:MAG: dNTP triphosphohydrolase, partial [bacterium]|nr:dNTP triphosphohydrolase [bacterium]